MKALTIAGALTGLVIGIVVLAVILGLSLLLVRCRLMNDVELEDIEDWEDKP